MELTNIEVSNFQILYKKYFGIELDHEAAYRKLSALVRQMEIVYRPLRQKQLDENEYQYEPGRSKINQ